METPNRSSLSKKTLVNDLSPSVSGSLKRNISSLPLWYSSKGEKKPENSKSTIPDIDIREALLSSTCRLETSMLRPEKS